MDLSTGRLEVMVSVFDNLQLCVSSSCLLAAGISQDVYPGLLSGLRWLVGQQIPGSGHDQPLRLIVLPVKNVELILDNIRYVQEHGAQHGMFLGKKEGLNARWIGKRQAIESFTIS